MSPKTRCLLYSIAAAAWNGAVIGVAINHHMSSILAVALSTPALLLAVKAGRWGRQSEVVEILDRISSRWIDKEQGEQ